MSRTVASIAAQIPAEAAQLALARVMAAMGSSPDWNADVWRAVERIVKPVAELAGLPAVGDADDAAHDFWSSVVFYAGRPRPIPAAQATPLGAALPRAEGFVPAPAAAMR
jgi:hypothetical protein